MSQSTLDIVASILEHNVQNKEYNTFARFVISTDNNVSLKRLRKLLSETSNINEILLNVSHLVPCKTIKDGSLQYKSSIPLLMACSENIDIMKLLAEELGFLMQIDPVSFLEFLYIMYREKYMFSETMREHIRRCTEKVDFPSVINYVRKVYPALTPGEVLYVYITGDIRHMGDRNMYDMREINERFHINSWRPFGIYLLTEHILKYNPNINKLWSPVRIIIEHFLKPTEDENADHAPAYFLLGMSDYSDMVNGMKTMGIIPPIRVNYHEYLIKTIPRYKNVLDRNYGSTVDIMKWNEDDKTRKFFFDNTDTYSRYNDLELLTVFGVNLNSKRRLELYNPPVLPDDFDTPRWRLSYFGCNDSLVEIANDSGNKIIRELDLKEDIVIAYGTFRNHRCWTASLLSDHYNSFDNIFYVPGYVDKSRQDVTYPKDTLSEQKYFNEEQIIELYLMLSSINKARLPKEARNLLELLDKYMNVESNVYLDNLTVKYKELEGPYILLFNAFLNWSLMLSLYARRWKGVGHMYPYSFLEAERIEGEEGKETLCSVEQSQVWITGQIRRYTSFMNMKYATMDSPQYWDELRSYHEGLFKSIGLSTEPNMETLDQLAKVITLIESLNVVEIDFGNLSPVIVNGTDSNFIELINKFTTGEVCSPHLSDIIRSTCVYHLVNIAGKSIDQIDLELRQFLIQSLSEYGANEETIKPISLNMFYTSGHIDPYLKLRTNRIRLMNSYTSKQLTFRKEANLLLSEHAYFWFNIPLRQDEVTLLD